MSEEFKVGDRVDLWDFGDLYEGTVNEVTVVKGDLGESVKIYQILWDDGGYDRYREYDLEVIGVHKKADHPAQRFLGL